MTAWRSILAVGPLRLLARRFRRSARRGRRHPVRAHAVAVGAAHRLHCAARRWLPDALAGLPALAFAGTVAVFDRHATAGGLRGRRYPAWAISVATSSAGPGSARAQRVLQQLTRRGCLSAVSAANAASSAARPRTEQRSAVGAQHRPPQHEPAPGAACRDAPSVGIDRRTAALGREQNTTPEHSTCRRPRPAWGSTR